MMQPPHHAEQRLGECRHTNRRDGVPVVPPATVTERREELLAGIFERPELHPIEVAALQRCLPAYTALLGVHVIEHNFRYGAHEDFEIHWTLPTNKYIYL